MADEKTITLPAAARAVFVTARALADDSGWVANRLYLATVLRCSAVTLRRQLGFLEGVMFRRRPLVQRRGSLELWVCMQEMPGIPSRQSHATETIVVGRQSKRHVDRRTDNGEWRTLRAKVGGLQRAFERAQQQKLAAERQVEEMQRARAAPPPVERELVALRQWVVHATTCRDHDCESCWNLSQRLQYTDTREPTGVEFLDIPEVHAQK